MTTGTRSVPCPSASPGADAPLDVHALQAPVPRPRQVFAIGLNYAAHAAEAGLERPTFPPTFTKFPTCLTGPDADRRAAERVRRLGGRARAGDRAARLRGRRRPTAGGTSPGSPSARTCPSGSCRRARRRPSSASASRSPASGRSGPGSSPPTSSPTPTISRSAARVNGEEVQKSRTCDLIFDVDALIHHLSSITPVAARRPHLHGHPVRRRRHSHAAPLPRPRRRARLHHRRRRHDPHPPRREERAQ